MADPELEALETSLNLLNLMDIFKISTSETSISAFLAWLLQPQENHGLGTYFLKYFLMECAKRSEDFTVIDIDRLNLINALVKTEENFRGKKVDITIKIEQENVKKEEWLKSFNYFSEEAKIIKLADRIDNLLDMDTWSNERQTYYTEQSKLIVESCGDAHEGLKKRLKELIFIKE